MPRAGASTARTSRTSAADFLPRDPDPSLKQLARAAERCRGCDLYKRATQAVFGEGPPAATVVLVGEQPGDEEDREGRPFVGPAGRLLDKALGDAGVDRSKVYVTNAVKHFRWTELRGKRRIHAKPTLGQIRACRPWLEAELDAIQPRAVVCLGATAAQSLLGPEFRITKSRGELIKGTPWAPVVMATEHPSALLRKPTSEDRRRAYAELVEDLRQIARLA